MSEEISKESAQIRDMAEKASQLSGLLHDGRKLYEGMRYAGTRRTVITEANANLKFKDGKIMLLNATHDITIMISGDTARQLVADITANKVWRE